MRVIISQLNTKPKKFKKDWKSLIQQVDKKKPDVLVLPELPFVDWNKDIYELERDEDMLAQGIGEHKSWLRQLAKMEEDMLVIYSAPQLEQGVLYNKIYSWHYKNGHTLLRTKSMLSSEEAKWFAAGTDEVVVHEWKKYRFAVVSGMELWQMDKIQKLAEQKLDLLICLRSIDDINRNAWLNCAQMAAMLSGAFCISSCKYTKKSALEKQTDTPGWIIRPLDGKILELCNSKNVIINSNINLSLCQKAHKALPLRDLIPHTSDAVDG